MDFSFTDLSLPQTYHEIFNPIHVGDPFFAAFWLAANAAFLYAVKRVTAGSRVAPLRFFSVESVAIILAEIPAFLILTDILNHGEIQWRTIGLFVLAHGSILAGIQAWRMLNAPRGGEPIPTGWSRFSSIFSGGMIGLISLFVTGFVFDIVAAFLQPWRHNDAFDLPRILRIDASYDPLDVASLLFLALWAGCFGAALFILRRRMRKLGHARIQFHITDYWAAMLALFPTFLFLSYMNEREEINGPTVARFALMALSTLGGSAAFLMLKWPEGEKPLFGRRTRFWSVLISGLGGLAALVVTAGGFMLLRVALAGAWDVAVAIFYTIYFTMYAWFWLCWFVPPLFFISIVCFRIEKKGYDLFVK